MELLKEEFTLSQLSKKYGVSGKTLQNWKKQFLTTSIAFDPLKVISKYKDQLNELQDKNDGLAKALGKPTVERDWAVEKLKSLDLLNKKSIVGSKLNFFLRQDYLNYWE